MTTCIQGRQCMTEQVQWTTMSIALLVVFVVGLGIYAVVKGIMEDNSNGDVNDSIAEFTEDLYLSRISDED